MNRFAGDIDLESYLSDADWSKATTASQAGRVAQELTNIASEANVGAEGLLAKAGVVSEEAIADATTSAASSRASASTFGALTDTFGSIATAGINAFGKSRAGRATGSGKGVGDGFRGF